MYSNTKPHVPSQPVFLQADWPAPKNVKTLITTRLHGASLAPYASFNLAFHTGDNKYHVQKNRSVLQKHVPVPIVYLDQIHSNRIVLAHNDLLNRPAKADGLMDRSGHFACGILTADCLPIFLCDQKGDSVAVVHAGWRGLAQGILENAIKMLGNTSQSLMAFLGPAISQEEFPVGKEVRKLFLSKQLSIYSLNSFFLPITSEKYLMDLKGIAREILKFHEIEIYSSAYCTAKDNTYFYSYRKEMQTGRLASVIWLENN
ncbi:MAG: peptidoglycan editing factor PgeF [Neisseriaceae bacterium]